MKITKKVTPGLFQDILEGKKNFEVRIADFNCKPGDTLVLEEWRKTKDGRRQTGRTLEKKVAYVLRTKDYDFYKKKDIERYGFQIIAFK